MERNVFSPGSRCFLCEDICLNSSIGFCDRCLEDLPRVLGACIKCTRPMLNSGVCATCLNHQDRFMFTDCLAATVYTYPVDCIIHQLKFNNQILLAHYLGRLLADQIKKNNIKLPECIVPVPLHPIRHLTRGYNQSSEIARSISSTLNIPMHQNICHRTRATQAQSLLEARQRTKNVRGCFTVKGTVNYKHIAIIDDVMTTGATVNELAKVFYKAGVKLISVWIVARSIL